MNKLKMIKKHNSKGMLVKAIATYQQALGFYAREDNWAVRGDDIMWVGNDDPTEVAGIVLGIRKQKSVRIPDSPQTATSVYRGKSLDESIKEDQLNELRELEVQQAGGTEGDGGSPTDVGSLDPSDAGREVRVNEATQETREVNQEQGGILPDDVRVCERPSDQLDQLSKEGERDKRFDGTTAEAQGSGVVRFIAPRT